MRSELVTALKMRQVESAVDKIMESFGGDFNYDEDRNWQFTGPVSGEATVGGGTISKEMSIESAQSVRMQAFRLFYTSPYGRGILRIFRKFVFGKGPSISSLEKTKSKKKIVDEYITEWMKANAWKITKKELSDRTFRDGEVFLLLRSMGKKKLPKMEFMEPDDIDSDKQEARHGIELDPKDPTSVLYYHKKNEAGTETTKYRGKEVVHIKINVDRNVKRGRSIFEPIFKYMKYHEDWLKDRTILNKVRNALALVRHIEGTQAQGQVVRNPSVATRTNATNPNSNRQKLFRPGTILNAGPGVKYEMLHANLGASDAATDGRNMLLGIAVGVGFPEMFLTADFSNANYSSSLTAQNPLVREFEDWQDFFEYYIEDLMARVIQIGIDVGLLPKGTSLEVKIDWPPMIYADLAAEANALGIVFNNGVISKHTYASRLDFDYDEEKELIEKEQEEEGGGQFGDEEEPEEPGAPEDTPPDAPPDVSL